MRIADEPGRGRFGDTLLPMINVVFLLLIFLMLMGEIRDPQVLDADPAEAALADRTEPAPLVVIDKTNVIGFGHTIGAEPVREALQRLLLGGEPPTAVTLRVDRSADFARVLQFAESLRELEIEAVSIQVRAK
ncbi:biopolymer transport protein ExbD [Roseibium hamelinense]|uniref:Biopolymer transport protein ExbD n=1 Tax=Roseibium hamelinense TaxID=150831 RepID=A0A562SQA6_9HYPH|nr:biopolymer transporter ExbD [Roseibium hamelinense]MTI44277.1 hypothetical protein [Roseibium hamelinense]TWI82950.1 biopolymer transport protein ExbD [Roseibium hamelinense]